jgi:nucleotide-binding universal stress UspA family protein
MSPSSDIAQTAVVSFEEPRMPAPIVVPLDRSAFAEEALGPASQVAARLHEPLELALVHVSTPIFPDVIPGTEPDLDAQIRAEERSYLEKLAQRLSHETGVSATTAVLDAPVAPSLIEHIRNRNAHLVVMTTHGRGGVSRLFLGSVADRLIRELHCPLLLLHGATPLAMPGPGDRRRILIPLDGSSLAESVIDQVLAVFGQEVRLDLVQVVPQRHDLLVGNDAPLAAPTAMEQSLMAANRYLQAIAVRLLRLGLEVHTEVRVDHSVADAILEAAGIRQSQLIAIATHGLGGIDRLLLGSVADKLVRSAHVPLLVSNPPAGASSEVLLSGVGSGAEPLVVSREAAHP